MPEVPGSILGGDVQFPLFSLVEKKFDDCEKKFLSVAKMAPTVYKTETCFDDPPRSKIGGLIKVRQRYFPPSFRSKGVIFEL